MEVREIMKRRVIKIEHTEKMVEAASRMREENVGCLVVTIHGSPQGIITDRDIVVRCTASGHNPSECEVGSHMSRRLVTIHERDDVLAAAHLMVENGVRRIPVVEEGILVGIISLPDITQSLARPLSDLMLAVGVEHSEKSR